jgi:hypothetical protein
MLIQNLDKRFSTLDHASTRIRMSVLIHDVVYTHTYTGTWLITCCMEKPGLKMLLHFFQNAPSLDSMFNFPAKGSMAAPSEGCLSIPDSETCRAISLDHSQRRFLHGALGLRVGDYQIEYRCGPCVQEENRRQVIFSHHVRSHIVRVCSAW